jgi:serine phosphatase RsbU (regulator of sigma subunit)
MLTGVVKSAFHSCHREDYDPHAVVERIAAGIRGFDAIRLVTVFCATLSGRSGGLRYVSAALPAALVWTDRGIADRLGPTGGIVSPVLPGAWRTAQRTIARDERLLLHTDGIIEAPGEDDLFGLERLEAALLAPRPRGVCALDVILEEAARFGRGRPPRDDATLLSVERA